MSRFRSGLHQDNEMTRHLVPLLALLSSLSMACTESGEEADAGAVTLSAGSGGTTTSESGEESTGDEGAKLDFGPGNDSAAATDGDGEGCEKIDLLFVIDNSGSMQTEQDNLIAAFPEFAATIQDVLPDASDLHIAVTTTDDLGLQPGSFGQDAQPFAEDPCMNQLGGLVDRATPVNGNSGYGEPCGFSSGQRYMTNGPALSQEFECAAAVGVHGNGLERHADAILGALDADDACAAGFVRDDALLVIVVITDEDDDWSEPDISDVEARVDQWYAAIEAVEGGVETNVVFTLISGGSPPWGTCPPFELDDPDTAKESDVLTTLARRFTNVFEADVCAPGYVDVFADAIGVIETACDEFVPIE